MFFVCLLVVFFGFFLADILSLSFQTFQSLNSPWVFEVAPQKLDKQ